MTFDALCDFIQTRMRMSHIYQPLLIKALVQCNGAATVRQIAYSFLSEDESQLVYYEKRIREMPVRVLQRHNVVASDGELVTLSVGKLTFQQKAAVRMLCEQKIHEFLEARGLATWDYRLLESDPVPDSIRFRVLQRSEAKCELCGCSAKERPLHVDHIIPRSRGGSNGIENLQALCSQCNRAKSNKDTSDFRPVDDSHAKDCPFCLPGIEERVLKRNDTVFAVEDRYPVTLNHLLVIPFRHTPEFFTMTSQEREHAEELARVMRNKVMADDRAIAGFNVGFNCCTSAGQTVMHAHMHLIPRRDGDVKQPKGGIRGAVPGKMDYRQG